MPKISAELAGGDGERTRANAKDFDATVWFGDPTSQGGKTTLQPCMALGQPMFVVVEGITRPSKLTARLMAGYVEVAQRGSRPCGTGFAAPAIPDACSRNPCFAIVRPGETQPALRDDP